jgi:hypothetical protein
MAAPINAIRKAVVTALENAALTCNGIAFTVQDCPVYSTDPDEAPVLQVSVVGASGTKAAVNNQVYDNDYQIMVSAICAIESDDGDELADVETLLADAMADADYDVQHALLPSWRTWAAGASKVEYAESKMYSAGEGSGHYGRVDIALTVTVQVRHGVTPTGSSKVRVEISPTPKTTAGWEG